MIWAFVISLILIENKIFITDLFPTYDLTKQSNCVKKNYTEECYEYFIERIYNTARKYNKTGFFNAIADSLSLNYSSCTFDSLLVNLTALKENRVV